MTTHRKRYSADFKAKVALEAMSGLHTLEEIASKYGIHPVMVSKWKNQLQKNASGAFGNSKEKKQVEEKNKKIEALYKTVGQREYELDCLKKKMGIDP